MDELSGIILESVRSYNLATSLSMLRTREKKLIKQGKINPVNLDSIDRTDKQEVYEETFRPLRESIQYDKFSHKLFYHATNLIRIKGYNTLEEAQMLSLEKFIDDIDEAGRRFIEELNSIKKEFEDETKCTS